MHRKHKNPITGKIYLSDDGCINSLERDQAETLKRANVTARQVMYNYRNNLGIFTTHGKSVMSKKPTLWNERAGRYERFADDAERNAYRQIFLDRMRRVHGKDHLLNDPNQQRLMLASRSISGEYTFQTDGTKRLYTGKEELAFLKFMDEAMGWPGKDVWAPAPQNFKYQDSNGIDHWYIPDAYIETLNLLVEVKGEMHNGYRSRDIEIEHTKDAVIPTNYYYVKVEDRDYASLLDAMTRASLMSI